MKIMLSTMEIDRAYHTIKQNMDKGYSRWHDCRDVGIEEDYYDYYYAEEGLIVIRDRMTHQLWLSYARSPGKALEAYRSLCRDLREAMTGEKEDGDVCDELRDAWALSLLRRKGRAREGAPGVYQRGEHAGGLCAVRGLQRAQWSGED